MATTSTRSPVQLFATVMGAVYLLIGILGFFVANKFTGGSADDKLIFFPVNHLHNVVHLAIGAAWLASARSLLTAKQVSLAIGVAYLLVAALGFVAKDFMSDLLNIETADNFLHLVSGALGVYFGTVGAAATPATPPA
ncbi:MAG: hypothetical protein QOG54_2055 [Actinomycetota bacterium]|jgi:hypothetical protein|nr:hypothetical protein [Actinomycetota bacterium]